MGESIYEQTWEEVFIFMSRVPCGTKSLSWCMILPWLYQAPRHSSPFSRMVASAQSEAPHFMSVPEQFTGQFICDSWCPMFGAYKICSHTLNPVESFLIFCSGLSRPYGKQIWPSFRIQECLHSQGRRGVQRDQGDAKRYRVHHL